jgi:hypothetical protein
LFCQNAGGLKNAWYTFNRIVRANLGTQLDRNVSIYVDDVVVRSHKRGDIKTFGKLSPTFGGMA